MHLTDSWICNKRERGIRHAEVYIYIYDNRGQPKNNEITIAKKDLKEEEDTESGDTQKKAINIMNH